MTKIKRKGGGDIDKISVQYDDGEEEECQWPDDDIVILVGMNVVEKKIKKKKKGDRGGANEMDMNEADGGGGDIGGEGTRVFSCEEPGCEYFSKWASA